MKEDENGWVIPEVADVRSTSVTSYFVQGKKEKNPRKFVFHFMTFEYPTNPATYPEFSQFECAILEAGVFASGATAEEAKENGIALLERILDRCVGKTRDEIDNWLNAGQGLIPQAFWDTYNQFTLK